MLDLARRGAGGEFLPLLAPLVRSVASQIEAISPLEMVTDPTRLAKGIGELRRAAGLDILVTAAPSAMEAQALGAEVDLTHWPPRLIAGRADAFDVDPDFDALFAKGELLSAAIEATERLAHDDNSGVVLVAALTGPATLLRQLAGPGPITEDARDFAAAATAALVRRFGQAGADLLVLVEDAIDLEDWADLYGTAGNTAKFLKKPLVVAADDASDEWPRLAIAKAVAPVLSPDPQGWDRAEPVSGARLFTTGGEVPAQTPLPTLIEHLSLLRGRLGV